MVLTVAGRVNRSKVIQAITEGSGRAVYARNRKGARSASAVPRDLSFRVTPGRGLLKARSSGFTLVMLPA
jgi:hypothetical protein